MLNSNDFIIQRLQKPKGKVDVVLDTDAYNEIDDQFAIAYALKSIEKINLLSIYAAPFSNMKASTPAEGMEKSYDEILNIIKLCEESKYLDKVYKGSDSYLANENTPVISNAVHNLIELAMIRDSDNPLYVVAIGAITNIASALLLCPEIASKIVLIWLGGHSFEWPDTKEFNMVQDIAAARVIFHSSVPVVQLPCMGVVSHLATTEPEMKYWLSGKNKLCDYLYTITCEEVKTYTTEKLWSRIIWGVSAIAWLIDESFVSDKIVKSPLPNYDGNYDFDEKRHIIKYAYWVNRDRIFSDLFKKLSISNN